MDGLSRMEDELIWSLTPYAESWDEPDEYLLEYKILRYKDEFQIN